MAYNKQNKQERLPKKEYFTLRLEQAIQDGLTDKADYYRSRIAQLEKAEQITNKFDKEERIALPVEGLFGSRDTIEEAFEYAHQVSKGAESPIHFMTPVFVLYNAIAEQYDLVPKAK